MKVSLDKNMSFTDQPKPMLVQQVRTSVTSRRPSRRLDRTAVDFRLIVPTSGTPVVEMSVERSGQQDVAVGIRIENFRPGRHSFPPPTDTDEVRSLGNKSPRRLPEALRTEGELPGHLSLRPVPRALPRQLRRPEFMHTVMAARPEKRGNQATTVFAPENRRVFSDTSYPWSACGRVDTPGGFASGVMVGPRHMLTVSHTIQWNADGSAGWVRFRPSFFDGSTTYGEAWASRIYFKYKVSGPTIDWVEGMYDYVVVVLNWNLGNLTGWMGSRGYTDGWDGGAYWAHVGYPGDLTGGNRPTFENSISLDGAWWQFDSHESMAHRGDVWPGQSGGPFFGWWSGESFPRAVAVQSSQSSGDNFASGGQDMVDLIIRARRDFP